MVMLRVGGCVLAIGIVGCASAHQGTELRPAALVVLENADAVEWLEVEDAAVSYEVTERYPAEMTLRNLEERMMALRYVKEQIVLGDPAVVEQRREGEWLSLTSESGRVWALIQDWLGPDGSLVTWRLEYPVSASGQIAERVSVTGLYLSPEHAEYFRKAVGTGS